MDSNNYRNRVLHGLAQELELPKLTFQAHDCDAGAKEGDSEGHSRRAQALPHHSGQLSSLRSGQVRAACLQAV